MRKKGDVFLFELVMSEWSDDGKRMFTGVMRDVTERERTADDVREAEARFTELFEAADEPLFIFAAAGDGEFALDSMNRAAEAFTGRSRFVARGWTPDELARAQGRALKRAMLEAVSAGAPSRAELPLPGEGAQGAVALTVTPMRGGTGEIRRVLVRAAVARTPAAGRQPA